MILFCFHFIGLSNRIIRKKIFSHWRLEPVCLPSGDLDNVERNVKHQTIMMDQDLKDCLFVLRFYGPVNPMGSCQARSVYLTTLLLGRLSPLSG